MTGVMLDIGSGTTGFVRLFRRFNPRYKLMYLCGEPRWKGVWSGEVKLNQVQKIGASYNQFNVPDASLNFVTLNAPHPLMPSWGIVDELIRTLVPLGGVFFSAHPVGQHPDLPAEFFDEIKFFDSLEDQHPRGITGFDCTKGCVRRIPVAHMTVDKLPVVCYPASWYIRNRLWELSLPEEFRERGPSYAYRSSKARPSIKVWLRNQNPTP